MQTEERGGFVIRTPASRCCKGPFFFFAWILLIPDKPEPSRHTCAFLQTSSPPRGANKMPMMKKVGSTDFAVKMGCHAFRRCCLNEVSIRAGKQREQLFRDVCPVGCSWCKGESPRFCSKLCRASMVLAPYLVVCVLVVHPSWSLLDGVCRCCCR
jgi:hypothetical protein